MDTSVAAELLIAATSLAGHLESTEDPKSAGCGTGFGFFQERDGAPLSLVGTREASSGEQGRNRKEEGMLKHEAGLSNPQGRARKRPHPTKPDRRGGGPSGLWSLLALTVQSQDRVYVWSTSSGPREGALYPQASV